MDKITELDLSYDRFITCLPEYVPEGVQEVDLQFLSRYHLLSDRINASSSSQLTRFFHVVETKEKITLFNDQFVVWIVPDKASDEAQTLVLVGIQTDMDQDNKEHIKYKLETAFATHGVYNSSKMVLRVVEKILADIQENEEIISHFEDV